jgi:3-phosphoshikimate 1-carboxyvinyltransferase
MLAVLASRAEGTSVFHDVGELRVKESDRLSLVARNLQTLGVDAVALGDDLFVTGTDKPPRGKVITEGDHRIAMAFFRDEQVERRADHDRQRGMRRSELPEFQSQP